MANSSRSAADSNKLVETHGLLLLESLDIASSYKNHVVISISKPVNSLYGNRACLNSDPMLPSTILQMPMLKCPNYGTGSLGDINYTVNVKSS
jgi:hypothetical protein